MPTKKDYSRRYPANYVEICSDAHQDIGQRCVLCLKKSKVIHHAAYGNDKPGYTVFPVCVRCHNSICHSPTNWIRHKEVMKSHNTPDFTEYLRMQYLYVQTVHNPIHGKLKFVKKKRRTKAK